MKPKTSGGRFTILQASAPSIERVAEGASQLPGGPRRRQGGPSRRRGKLAGLGLAGALGPGGARARSAAIGLLALAALVIVAVISAGGGDAGANKGAGKQAGDGARSGRAEMARGAAHRGAGNEPSQPALPAVEAGLMPWQLQAPVSREAVLALAGPDQFLVAGGLASGGTSAAGIYRLNALSGQLTFAGNLAVATHDAAAAVAGGAGYIFGGGGASPSAAAQSVQLSGASERLAPLPAARADAAAVTIGGTVYLVGGYSGAGLLDAQVLATSSGRAYRDVAKLPVPVRYPAVAALGGWIYVFGGETAAGEATSAVQAVDPFTGTAKVAGRLPEPLFSAAAGVLGGTIYIAGGLRAPGLVPTRQVLAFDRAKGSFLPAGWLPVGLANTGAAVSGGRLWLIGGERAGGALSSYVEFVRPDRSFGLAGTPGAGSPYYGDKLLVADRGNDRLLLLDDTGKVVWSYPSPRAPAPPGGFYFPDDAFFIRHGTAIISNQEENDTLVEIAFPSGRVIWSYGHPRTPGVAPGYLNNPDDAYLLKNGNITVADPMNCRVVVIDPRTKEVVHQIGTPADCSHNPPGGLGSPNGDTPLLDGNLLVSEITGSWVDEYTQAGRLVWAVQLPIGYPSDPQQLGPDRYLIADYELPGAIVEFNRAGQVLYRFQPASGPAELNHPSLVELLPSGVFMLNDDYNDRMVAIDPSTGALVWQYGHTGVPGAAPGFLNAPDGFDILGPGGATPTHPATG
jgi:outer membrane protein assembly factor BamB